MRKILRVHAGAGAPTRGVVVLGRKKLPCALGENGILPEAKKREGDAATPAGLYFPVALYSRRERINNLKTKLPKTEILENSGWCDDPGCGDYNQYVTLPHAGSAEKLWRKDELYDIILVISHNREPVMPSKGSAIFFHLATADFTPTQGCVALQKNDLIAILGEIGPGTLIRIHACST